MDLAIDFFSMILNAKISETFKIKHFFASKDIIKGVKSQLRKYLQPLASTQFNRKNTV